MDIEPLPVREARAGISEAWDRLFHRYQLAFYSYVFGLVGDDQTSLDIVQETFINAARHIHTLRDDAKFGSWLFGIAHQKCVQRHRRARVEELPLAELRSEPAEGHDDPGTWLIRKEQEDRFLDCLGRLAPPHRAVLLLHCLEDFSLEEIAAITDVSVGTVKSRIHYAKKALRRLWEEQP